MGVEREERPFLSMLQEHNSQYDKKLAYNNKKTISASFRVICNAYPIYMAKLLLVFVILTSVQLAVSF